MTPRPMPGSRAQGARTNQSDRGVAARREARPDVHEATPRPQLTARHPQIANELIAYPQPIHRPSTGSGAGGPDEGSWKEPFPPSGPTERVCT